MSDYEEDIFFDEEEKKERAGAEVSEDDFDDVSDDMKDFLNWLTTEQIGDSELVKKL